MDLSCRDLTALVEFLRMCKIQKCQNEQTYCQVLQNSYKSTAIRLNKVFVLNAVLVSVLMSVNL
jgi:hypothetical protein